MGSRNSYGDEFQNQGEIVLDMTQMNQIKSWNPETGVLVVEPGVTFQQALRICLKDNWVLPVAPGTRFPTIGGAGANNVHGKNSYKVGNFGEFIIEFDLLLANNEIITCSRDKNSELFFAVIGGIGMLGVITSLTLQTRKVKSPSVSVKNWIVPNLSKMLQDIEKHSEKSDYIIGQIDCFATGKSLGRGTINAAVHVDYKSNNYINDLEIKNTIFSVVPSKLVLTLGKFLMCETLMRTISSLKYYMDMYSQTNSDEDKIESFPKFNFHLDRIPSWPKVFEYGLYEFEPLIPRDKAYEVINKMIKITHEFKMPPYLCGIKLHREDDFVLSYSLDGFSIGFDFPVLPKRKNEQDEMFSQLHEIVVENGGQIYLAKDNMIFKANFRSMYGSKIDEILSLKAKYDPNMLFQSNMFRRLFL
jgi:FAD/FMN-containing dehydrogenase